MLVFSECRESWDCEERMNIQSICLPVDSGWLNLDADMVDNLLTHCIPECSSSCHYTTEELMVQAPFAIVSLAFYTWLAGFETENDLVKVNFILYHSILCDVLVLFVDRNSPKPGRDSKNIIIRNLLSLKIIRKNPNIHQISQLLWSFIVVNTRNHPDWMMENWYRRYPLCLEHKKVRLRIHSSRTDESKRKCARARRKREKKMNFFEDGRKCEKENGCEEQRRGEEKLKSFNLL